MAFVMVCSVFYLLFISPSLSSASTSETGSCSYKFDVWTAGSDVKSRLSHLEAETSNITSRVSHEVLVMRNEMLQLERDLMALRLESYKQSNVNLAPQMEELRANTQKMWTAIEELQISVNDRRSTEVSASDGDVTADRLEVEQQLATSSALMQQLKNGVGDLKAEWVLLKRQVLQIQTDSDEMMATQSQVQSDTEALKNQMAELGELLRGYERAMTSRVGRLEQEAARLEGELDYVRDRQTELTRGLARNASLSANETAQFIRQMVTAPAPAVTARPRPRDCHDVYQAGFRSSGVYDIFLADSSDGRPVYCKMINDSGWTVFQRRVDGSLDFHRHWLEYKYGFGNPYGEFWWGNELLHQMTARDRKYRLRVELWDWEGHRAYAEYGHFRVGAESDSYELLVRHYTGDVGDSLGHHDGMPFSSHDVDNDLDVTNCAAEFQGGWWFNRCFSSHLNGRYHSGYYSNHTADGVVWFTWKLTYYYSLRQVQMMIKPA